MYVLWTFLPKSRIRSYLARKLAMVLMLQVGILPKILPKLSSFFLVSSFIELLPLILSIPGVKSFLSERLSQDPLEKFLAATLQLTLTPTPFARTARNYV